MYEVCESYMFHIIILTDCLYTMGVLKMGDPQWRCCRRASSQEELFDGR
jgi:hypothetical protein